MCATGQRSACVVVKRILKRESMLAWIFAHHGSSAEAPRGHAGKHCQDAGSVSKKHTCAMERRVDGSTVVPPGNNTHKAAWKQLAHLLKMTSMGRDPQVLSYLEKHYHGLVLRDGNNDILLRRGFEPGDDRQKSARQRWIKAECPQMNKAEILQRMVELRGWLLAYFHRDQRYLVVPGSAASDVVVAHEEQKVMTKAPDIVPTFNPGFLCAKPAACPGHAKAVPEASHEDWMVGSSPILGSAATLGVKRVCVNVWQRLWGWLREKQKGQPPLMWNPEWLQQVRRGTSSLVRMR